jgi:predicted butyrate kinase (DUF1464 family)
MNPFYGGIFADDLYGISTQLARIKDGSDVKEHTTKVNNKVETVLKIIVRVAIIHLKMSKRNLQLFFRSQKKSLSHVGG